MLGMYVFYASSCVIDYCICWVVAEWFVCFTVLKVCVDLKEVVSCVHYVNTSAFITWFDELSLCDKLAQINFTLNQISIKN